MTQLPLHQLEGSRRRLNRQMIRHHRFVSLPRPAGLPKPQLRSPKGPSHRQMVRHHRLVSLPRPFGLPKHQLRSPEGPSHRQMVRHHRVGESAPAVRVTEPPTTLTRGSVAQADGQTPQFGEPSPIPTPPAGSAPTSSSTSYIPVAPPSGPFFDTLLEEKIADHAIVVRATMSSFSSEVVVDANNKYQGNRI